MIWILHRLACLLPPLPVIWERAGVRAEKKCRAHTALTRADFVRLPSPGVPGEGEKWPRHL
jgi:hypothetical protein